MDTHAPTVSHPNARVHLYDNYTTDDADYAVEASCGAQILLEGNTFQNVLHPTTKTTCADFPNELGLVRAHAGSNLYRDNVGSSSLRWRRRARAGRHRLRCRPMNTVVDPPATAWVNVLARAGAGGPWPCRCRAIEPRPFSADRPAP